MATDAVKRRAPSAYDLNLTYFEKVARGSGWTTSKGFNVKLIASELGISDEQVRRVLGRTSRPGVTFMAGLQRAVDDYRVRLMFPLVYADEPIGKD